ncbi:hypothetical protein P280DRAFT_464069 [Massarina eburnea CBS 473.64]|uniref:BTB domain-containing protein n=1 Tax=Massarina eburnea CBS 473.64 TaxID=1395130 RepID=A0A6A6RJL3_9PLEO|nr:hypothetical protein P280DRAFT_464069 [Massarina eburnea CBS 473.64]
MEDVKSKGWLKELLDSGAYSDLTVTCGPDTYKLHKAVVCSQSGFFAAAMRFTAGKEVEDGTIDFPDDDPAAMKLLVQFMYLGDYEPYLDLDSPKRPLLDTSGGRYTYDFPHTCKFGCPSPDHRICPHHQCWQNTCNTGCVRFVCTDCTDCNPPAVVLVPGHETTRCFPHSIAYEIADKYQINELKELARKKFSMACALHWKENEFLYAAQHACTSTMNEDMGLRLIVAKTVAAHIELFERDMFKQLLSEHGNVAVAVLEEMIGRWQ